ncbi:type I-G CRISPR-associated RAMP protein Csb1/Cas7g [Streptomyces celluloflavus]|uniref:type I-G CRISPR-associated RAMP protein Csb1/Cas7g n=1 Tax=Streptomyces celluloflavus TaxID=58344 RepID=UPI00346054CC|nr:type I-U CRISPR-associated RAMP protein Csb1/Cas7u [Streptomyces celluloflavus]
MKDVYERLLAAASMQSGDGAIRIASHYEPLGGPGEKVFPPAVTEKGGKEPRYLVEPRYVDDEPVDVVCLDQVQSQANRCEVALLKAIGRGELFLPHLELSTVAHGMPVRVTSLEASHRSRDAYFRDSEDSDGTAFDETEAGAELRDARDRDAGPYLRLAPSDLAYGVWDSHRKRRIQVRIARAYQSTMIGVAPLIGVRAAGRVDPLNLAGKDVVELSGSSWSPTAGKNAAKGTKTAKMSELGHGMIPPSEGLGGVSVKAVQRNATLSLAKLAGMRFGEASEEFAATARALVAAIALLGDRLAFAAPALSLRSGCDLVMVSERIEWVRRGHDGSPQGEALELSTAREALELFRVAEQRAREAGLEWAREALVVRPNASLQQAIEKSFVVGGAGTSESE